jgi:uncharacterized protein (TIGR02611 family)
MYKRKKDTFTIKTLKQAKRVTKIVIGLTVVMFGAAMLLLPGPGMITIILGLAILGTEFVWARTLIKRFEQHANNVKNSIFNNTKKIKARKSEIGSE